jgi:4-hydroxy-4-methyl-2-oxoglutarate aldolase
LIVGDADGVTVVERDKAASLLPLAAKKVAEERQRIAEITGGGPIRPKWLEASLVAAGALKAGEAL